MKEKNKWENTNPRVVMNDSYISEEYFIKQGFQPSIAKYFCDCIKNEKNHPDYDPVLGKEMHNKGILLQDAYRVKISQDNISDYLTDYEYYRYCPWNNWSRIWINDKLTLKYILEGTKFSDLMPEYYFYSTQDGLKSLMDNPYQGEQSEETFLKVLRLKGAMACKPNNGTESEGFMKLSWKNGDYFCNDHSVTEQEILDKVKNLPNYIFTEYFYPSEQMAEIHPQIHTVRVVVLNAHGNDPYIVYSCIRFPTGINSNINYTNLTDQEKFNFYASVDLENGHIYDPHVRYFNRVEHVKEHPNTKKPIDLYVPEICQIKEIAKRIAAYMPTLEWLGYDFCITPDGIKMMEINGNPALFSIQYWKPLWKDPVVAKWLKKKMNISEDK